MLPDGLTKGSVSRDLIELACEQGRLMKLAWKTYPTPATSHPASGAEEAFNTMENLIDSDIYSYQMDQQLFDNSYYMEHWHG